MSEEILSATQMSLKEHEDRIYQLKYNHKLIFDSLCDIEQKFLCLVKFQNVKDTVDLAEIRLALWKAQLLARGGAAQ